MLQGVQALDGTKNCSSGDLGGTVSAKDVTAMMETRSRDQLVLQGDVGSYTQETGESFCG